MSIEALKASLLDHSKDAIIVGHLTDGAERARIVYANDAFRDFCGRADAVLDGQFVDLFFDQGPGFCVQALDCWEGLAGAGISRSDIAIIHADGSKRPVDATLIVKNAGPEGVYISVSCRCAKPASRELNPRAGMQNPEISRLVDARDAAIRERERIVSALDAYPDPFVVYDENLILQHWNTAYGASMTGSLSELRQGMSLREVLGVAVANGQYPEAIGRENDWINGILSQNTLGQQTDDVELKNDIHHRLIRHRAENGDYVVIRLNSTELVRQKRAAEDAQARLIAALNAYPSPFVIYDSDDCIVVWNDAYSDSMSDGSEVIKVGMHRTDVARIGIRAGKFAAASGREEEWMSDEHQELTLAKPIQDIELAGDIHHRLLRSRAENGDLVIVRIDTTELVRQRRAVEQYAQRLELANQEISYQADHDDLTGLGNRRLLKRKFDEFEARRKQEGGEIAALHIDLDRFKQINDTIGHPAGDQVLLDVSERIRFRAKPDEVICRIGGDEFVVLIYVPTRNGRPVTLAKQLLGDLARPSYFEGKECRFGASIGMAITPITSVDDLLTNSDIALYKAKNAGRGRLAIFDRNDFEEVRSNKALADDVLRGIEQDEFVPFFQPQIDALSGKLVGLEVLARWKHPAKGILAPAAFLSVATDLSVVADIDKAIFERAIAQANIAFSNMENVPSLSFNVSASRVNDHDVSDIRQHVQSYAGPVAFELLETIFLEEEDEGFFLKLDQFRELGLSIEVDDFGSGRASVVALQRIAPDRLKIDRRLVAPITESAGGLRLLQSIVEIGHALEMGVTAEGVETRAQAALLAQVGCDRLQGYYFSKPLALPDIVTYLDPDHPLGTQPTRSRRFATKF